MATVSTVAVEILGCVQDDMVGRSRSYWTYILVSTSRVLYIGVTNDLARRVAEHRVGKGGAFATR